MAPGANVGGGLEAVSVGHGDIHHHHVRPQIIGQFHGALAVAGLAHHHNIVALLQVGCQRLT